MRFIQIFLIIICLGTQLHAQNVPDGSTLPNTTGMTLPGHVSTPTDYDDPIFGVNPTLFNYSRRYTPLTPMTAVPPFSAAQNTAVHITTTYKDGFGSPLMIINRNGSSRDIIQPFNLTAGLHYTVNYLPYPYTAFSKFQMKPIKAQESYYLNKFPDENTTAYTKTEVIRNQDGIYETRRYKPGAENVGYERAVVSTGHTNDGGELWYVYYQNGTVCKSGTYAPYELFVNKVVNESGNETIEYSDKSQRILCKKVADNYSSGSVDGYLYTYYLYNELGKIKYILPPKATEQLHANSCLTNIDELCFRFEYDMFGNVIEKHTPGRDGPDQLVYNVNYQNVMSRSPNMASNDEWAFTIHDKLGRVVMTGIYTGTETATYWRDVVVGNTTPVNRGVPQEETLEYWLQNYFSGTSYPTNLDGCEIHTYNYYDDYTNVPAGSPTTFDNSFSQDYLTGANIQTPTPYYYAQGKLVASQTRILDNNIANNFTNTPWTTSVYFYDERDRLIQTHTLNPWNTQDWDVATFQYNFINEKILDITKIHSWAQSAKPVTTIRNMYEYGTHTGRLETVQQMVDNGAWQPIAGFIYDEMGQVAVKWLGNVEEQHYSFDIRGNSTGINADDLMNTSSVSNTKTFYSKLAYDHGFSDKKYDGTISGFQWRTRGSDVMAYGYEHDEMGRLTHAEFRAYNNHGGTPNWNKNDIDFTVSNIGYDPNGNILHMDQRGYDASMNPVDIDMLTYTYDAGNRLEKVTDAGVASAAFIKDFDNGSSGTNNDYQYDNNGNLKADLNKDIVDITYNHMDLPLSVTTSTGSIDNIYSASGTLLQKTITENGNTDVFRYCGPFVFKNDDVEYMLHQEGRARYDAGNDDFTYDFFVKDHLGNVRTVIEGSNSYDQIDYHAGWEIISANVEESIFNNLGEVRQSKPNSTVMTDLESGKLNGGIPGESIGATLLVHTMAGDQFNFSGWGYYEQEQSEYNMYTMPENMLASLTDVLTGGAGGAGGGEGGESTPVQTINNLLTNANYTIYDDLKNSITNNAFPRAYLNYLVFDEQFNLRAEHSKVVQIQGGANTWLQVQMPTNMIMPITGYLLVYMSNESPMDVYVDNEHLIHYESNLMDENNYYPHGLVIESGSQGVPPKNDYLHQGKKLQHELGLELYDFHARQYDPQIGRFWGIDPADQFPSGYTGMGNDPANMVDPSGMWSEDHGWATDPDNDHGNVGYSINQRIRRREERYALALNDALVKNKLEMPHISVQSSSMDYLRSLVKQGQAEFMQESMHRRFMENSKTLTLTDKVGKTGAKQTSDGSVVVGKHAEKVGEINEKLAKKETTELESKFDLAMLMSGNKNSHTDIMIILLDEDAVGGSSAGGHVGLFIGGQADDDKFLYLSKDGSTGSLPFHGNSDAKIISFNTPGEFTSSPQFEKYDKFILTTITHDQSEIIKSSAIENINKTYNVAFSNCVQAFASGLDKAGFSVPILTIFPTKTFNLIKNELDRFNVNYYYGEK